MRERGSPSLWARWGVRVRSALAAVLVLALALALAAAALLWLLQHSLQSAADDAASARASQLGAHLSTGPLEEIDPTLLATDGRTTVIQVLNSAGQVVLSSTDAPATPLIDVHPDPGVQRRLGKVDNTTAGGTTASPPKGSAVRAAFTPCWSGPPRTRSRPLWPRSRPC